MIRFSTLLLILLSYNLGYSYFSLDPNILEYGNLKFNKTLSGTGESLSDSTVVLNAGDVMIILRFSSNRNTTYFFNEAITGNFKRGGLYVYTKNSAEDETLSPVNTKWTKYFDTSSPPNVTQLSEDIEGTYIVGPKIVLLAWQAPNPTTSFVEAYSINCEMDYAIQRKRTVNPQPVSQ